MLSTEATTAQVAAEDVVRRGRDRLVNLSHTIWAHPELKWEEERASAWVAEALSDGGFAVTRGGWGLPTAVDARAGSGPIHIAFCAEYDALPDIGHACGHNIIAATAVGAGLALARVADDLGVTVRVIGTPAEEGGGGKIELLERDAFVGVHAALMVHPFPRDIAELPLAALDQFGVRYTGRAAHAGAYPEQGRNAADALTVAQVAIGLLRQHLTRDARVHGICTHGGAAPNIVPASSEAEFMIRSTTVGDLDDLRDRVLDCFRAGATATGTTLEVTPRHQPYAEMHHDAALMTAYRRNAERLGRIFDDGDRPPPVGGATDMGNVSLAVPAIHPAIGIDCGRAANHQPEFTAACVTESADAAVVDGALALAWTAIDWVADTTIRR
jgi:amidohydrolase